jgi:N-acetyl-gamma-glutamyl-phosphate reductase
MKKVFIDGKAGTTGLRIYDRIKDYQDIELITLSETARKDLAARRQALNSADIVFLCLPDQAAKEAVSLIENPATIVIDTSTAHRTDPNWTYGFPELSDKNREQIIRSKRISVPGCHASGFIALIHPLINAEIIPQSIYLNFTSLTGYSGGGKVMIGEYNDPKRAAALKSPRQYALKQNHKHLIEVKTVTGMDHLPHFSPIVADYYSGIQLTIPLLAQQLVPGKSIQDIIDLYQHKYRGPVVSYQENLDDNGFIAANKLEGSDSMIITVEGNRDRILLLSIYDNLGKGASGAALQCLNIILNKPETYKLEIYDKEEK